jgi:hypothetical protein
VTTMGPLGARGRPWRQSTNGSIGEESKLSIQYFSSVTIITRQTQFPPPIILIGTTRDTKTSPRPAVGSALALQLPLSNEKYVSAVSVQNLRCSLKMTTRTPTNPLPPQHILRPYVNLLHGPGHGVRVYRPPHPLHQTPCPTHKPRPRLYTHPRNRRRPLCQRPRRAARPQRPRARIQHQLLPRVVYRDPPNIPPRRHTVVAFSLRRPSYVFSPGASSYITNNVPFVPSPSQTHCTFPQSYTLMI